MLKVFKNYVSKTSILDDFMYYENRQKILQEEKARLLIKSYVTPVYAPTLHPPRKLNGFFDLPSSGDERSGQNTNIDATHSSVSSVAGNFHRQVVDGKPKEDDVLRIQSLALTSPERTESKRLENTVAGGGTSVSAVSTESSNVLTVGSMPVKVNGLGELSSFLTVGTIPLDPKALKVKEVGASTDSTKATAKKG